jgi:cellulose synthase/poly-beta-1,6-N-acetylglucosamine synthase-like glycosyltransferase
MTTGAYKERWLRAPLQALRRQWAQPARLPGTPAIRFETGLGWLVMGMVLVAAVITAINPASQLGRHLHAHHWAGLARDGLLLLVVALLAFNTLMHLVTRMAAQKKLAAHVPVNDHALAAYFVGAAPAVTLLIPCQGEDEPMLARALMSAALQTYPQRRVVLLIDNNQGGDNQGPVARALSRRIQQSLQAPADKFTKALTDFRARQAAGPMDMIMEQRLLTELNLDAAECYRSYAQGHPGDDHVDSHFVEKVLERQCNEHLTRAQVWQARLAGTRAAPGAEMIALEYRRLAALFSVEITSFERARYANLSQAPGRAMNLNGYIGLTGKYFHERLLEGGLRYLEEGDYFGTYFHVPDADFFLVLDADSYVAPDCLLKLMHFMQQPGREKTAITQIPGHPAPNTGLMLQRVAGALMDLRSTGLLGYARHDAASWVEESGLIRKSALRDIARTQQESGLSVTRYFSANPACGGMATNLRLLRHAWRVTSHPERLAWTSAPAELGVLAARYRRWHDGGLITLPGLLRYLWRQGWRKPLAALLRIHQQLSTLGTNLALLAFFSLALPGAFYNAWLGAAVLGYALLLTWDLKRAGYPWSDALRAYALKLLLLPVNLGGALISLHRAWTRTATAWQHASQEADDAGTCLPYYLAAYGLLIYWFVVAAIDLTGGLRLHGLVVALNAALLLYAVAGYIGFRDSLEDVHGVLRRRLRQGALRGRIPSSGLALEADFAHDRATLEAVERFDPPLQTRESVPADPYVHHTTDLQQDVARSRRVLVPQNKPSRH